MFDLAKVQSALREFGFDGWLLYDFRGSNILARRILGLDGKHIGSRRFFYWIPASGMPRKLVHRIEDSVLDALPGDKTIFLSWQELEAGVQQCVSGSKVVAMEYSPRNGNPYVSKVDAGVVELVRSFGCDVQSSGDIVQLFEATLDDEQIALHFEAATHNNSAYEVAWKFIADGVRKDGGVSEAAVRDRIMEHYAAHSMTTYSPPIVGRNAHSGLPHYETGNGEDTTIREGDFVLIDQWAKLKKPNAVYSDLTRTGYVGKTVPETYTKIFNIVAAARDAGIAMVQDAFAKGTAIRGFEVDNAVRKVIVDAGYGQFFVHRTGHNIGRETHGNGANIDGLETRDDRRLLPRTCFSIEPGIYLSEFGVRSETNVLIDEAGKVHVTGGELQTAVVPILGKY
ncbi:Xaa-Pro dipeptidase [Caulifigura coniformis]|uniref:Xaa-Pro dipeptidase n=1 Tax=Caulifigura coniformis TaxID=2527983 RepID=A0A517S8E7_9PLAN|nr:M24 family metallopeptidase [Caulifigura coniformis]QDT52383.1 Xaa-Pro dipeptidase [Caulifigura coniformis]